jgi:predicted membrane-bound dolichyl-phosphate-mannose-protein mannosyltransferase
MFLQTNLAEYYLQAVHFLIHGLITLLVGELGYMYFSTEPLKAQLICFLFLGNEEVRELNQLMFNDSILALYVILCIYSMVKDRPGLAALMLSLAISIKAGALLLLPGVLGWT